MEVAAINMGRVRLVWSRIWSVISGLLVSAVAHPDERVMRHATDGLQQVATWLLR